MVCDQGIGVVPRPRPAESDSITFTKVKNQSALNGNYAFIFILNVLFTNMRNQSHPLTIMNLKNIVNLDSF